MQAENRNGIVRTWLERLAVAVVAISLVAGCVFIVSLIVTPFFFLTFPKNLIGAAMGAAGVAAFFLFMRYVTGQNLIESLIVVGIMGLLAVLLLPAVRQAREKKGARQQQSAPADQSAIRSRIVSRVIGLVAPWPSELHKAQ